MAYTIQGRDVNLDIKRIVGYRQFCNKLWNACRFAIEYIVDFKPTATMHLELPSHPGVRNRDLSILSKLNNTIIACNTHMQAYLFGNVSSALYSFFLYDLCDVYLELIKPVICCSSYIIYMSRTFSTPMSSIDAIRHRGAMAKVT